MATNKLENLLKSNGNGELRALVKRAQSMCALTAALSAALPGEFADSIVAANIRENGELIVIARSSAWAARLRFEADTLNRAARSTGASVTGVSVRVTQSST
tara:strand:- start:2464 stop:2769 length:306 start_codon:yes stop_codon:yes gene_type:complete